MQEGSHPSAENEVSVDEDSQRTIVHAPPSSSRLDHLLAPPSLLEKTSTVPRARYPGCKERNGGDDDHQDFEATTGLPSFASYLSDLENVLPFQGGSTSRNGSSDRDELRKRREDLT